ncbi:MAG: sigma-70 family RNA polymerase sigma factor [Cyanobacteriota bacterium]
MSQPFPTAPTRSSSTTSHRAACSSTNHRSDLARAAHRAAHHTGATTANATAPPRSLRQFHSPAVRSWIHRSCSHQPLAETTVVELARQIRRWQDHPAGPERAPASVQRAGLRARNVLVAHNLQLISHVWSRHRAAIPGVGDSTADALQEAAISLVRAATKFDPSRGYSFSTYACHWLRQGFGHHERQFGRMIRLPHHKLDLLARVVRLREEHLAETGEAPTVAWLAERCGPRGTAVPVAMLEELLRIWRQTLPLELDRPLGNGAEAGPLCLLDQVPARHSLDPCAHEPSLEDCDLPDGSATYASCVLDDDDPQRALLPLLLERLDVVSRRLLWHRYLREHPLSTRQIKKVMGLSLPEQQRLETQAMELMRQMAQQHQSL